MFDVKKLYETNSKTEISGKEVKVGDNTWVTVARDQNKKYSAVISALYQENKFVLEAKGDAAEAKFEEITIEAMSQTILVGWRGDMAFDGKPVTYSQENAKLLLSMKDFRDMITGISKQTANYRMHVEKETVKN